MNLHPISFAEFNHLHYEFILETTGKNSYWYTLIAKWIGNYRDGSLGNPDAEYMYGITKTALEVWHPAALILDFSELRYEWGDLLEKVFDVGASVGKPTAVVVGPHCQPAISSLLWGLSSKQSATEYEGFFDTIEAAWAYVRKEA